jgi:hypothetical protein
MAKYLINISGDMNDGDDKIETIFLDDTREDDAKQLDILKRGAALIKEYSKKYPHSRNWGKLHHMDRNKQNPDDFYKEKLGEEDADWFFDMMPSAYSDYRVHTINDIIIYEIVNEINLL